MTRVNKSKDRRIGPEPTIVLPKPVAPTPVNPKPFKRMNKAELIEIALDDNIDIEGLTKAQLIAGLEK